MNNKSGVYKMLRLGCLLSYIPVVLAVGPIAGYYAGIYLTEKFHFPGFSAVVLSAVGFMGGVREAVRIIRIALKTEGDDR